MEESSGSADSADAESEIWCDARVLQPAYRRGDTFQSVYARLESAGDFDAFKDALTTDPRLDVMVEREDDYYLGQTEAVTAIITGIATVIAFLMGIGAVFGAVNTMYTAVAGWSSRASRERSPRRRARRARCCGLTTRPPASEVGAVYMPAGVSGSPMTYLHEGVQYIVVAVSGGGHAGGLLAYRLPD